MSTTEPDSTNAANGRTRRSVLGLLGKVATGVVTTGKVISGLLGVEALWSTYKFVDDGGSFTRAPEPERFRIPNHELSRSRVKRAWDVVAHKLSPHRGIESVADIREALSDDDVTIVDVDTRASRNGIPVTFHDRNMLVINGTPWPVELFTDGTLAQEGIERLEAAYAGIPAGKSLALDIKAVYGWAGSPRRAMLAVANMLIEHPERRVQTRLWLAEGEDIEEFRHLMDADALRHPGNPVYADVQTGISVSTKTVAETRAVIDEGFKHYAQSISVRFGALDKGTVDYAHRNGLYIYVWDLKPEQYAEASQMGVDCINADDPHAARQAMNKAHVEWDQTHPLGD